MSEKDESKTAAPAKAAPAKDTKAATPPAPPEADPTEKAQSPKAKKRPPFYVVDGKAVTTKRGIRADGDEVIADDFNEGKKTIADLIESGHVAKGNKA